MKTLQEHLTSISESNSEWNPSLKSHKDAFNSFIKWYDKYIGTKMTSNEMLDMLRFIISEIETDSLDFIK